MPINVRFVKLVLLCATVVICSIAIAADKEFYEVRVKSELEYQILATALYDKYGCSDFSQENPGGSVHLTAFEEREIGSVDDRETIAVLDIEIGCEGGPSIITDALFVKPNRIRGYFHKPFAFVPINTPEPLTLPVEDPEALDSLIRGDAFVIRVWPNLAVEVEGLNSSNCEPASHGDFINFWNSDYYERGKFERISFLLSCRESGTTHIFEFEGLYDAIENAIEWVVINIDRRAF